MQWDSKLIAEAMKTGKDRAPCLIDIQASLLAHDAAFETYRADPTPERQNKLFIVIMTPSWRKYYSQNYSQKAEINEQQEQDRKEHRKLFGERRKITQNLIDTPQHDAPQ